MVLYEHQLAGPQESSREPGTGLCDGCMEFTCVCNKQPLEFVFPAPLHYKVNPRLEEDVAALARQRAAHDKRLVEVEIRTAKQAGRHQQLQFLWFVSSMGLFGMVLASLFGGG